MKSILLLVSLLLACLAFPVGAIADGPARPHAAMMSPKGVGLLKDASAITNLTNPPLIASSPEYRAEMAIMPGNPTPGLLSFVYTSLYLHILADPSSDIQVGLWQDKDGLHPFVYDAYGQPQCINSQPFFNFHGCLGAVGAHGVTLGIATYAELNEFIPPIGEHWWMAFVGFPNPQPIAILPVDQSTAGGAQHGVDVDAGEQWLTPIDPEIPFLAVLSHPEYFGIDLTWTAWDASGPDGDNMLNVLSSDGRYVCPVPYSAYAYPADSHVWAMGSIASPPGQCHIIQLW